MKTVPADKHSSGLVLSDSFYCRMVKPAVGAMAGFLVGLVMLMTVGEPVRFSNQLMYVPTAQPTAVQVRICLRSYSLALATYN